MIKTLENSALKSNSFYLLKKLENLGDSVAYFRACQNMNSDFLDSIKDVGLFRKTFYNLGEIFDNREVDYEKFR